LITFERIEADDASVEVGEGGGGGVPAEGGGVAAASLDEVGPACVVLQDPFERAGECGDAGGTVVRQQVRLDDLGGVADHLGERSGVGGHHGNPGVHRLERRHAEALVARRIREHVGPPQQRDPVGLADRADPDDACTV